AAATQRVAEANQTGYRFFERQVAADAAAHAFANEDHRLSVALSRAMQRFPMSCDEQGQGIGPPPALLQVGVIERRHFAHAAESLLPASHPRMRRGRAGAGSKQK